MKKVKGHVRAPRAAHKPRTVLLRLWGHRLFERVQKANDPYYPAKLTGKLFFGVNGLPAFVLRYSDKSQIAVLLLAMNFKQRVERNFK